MAGQKKLERTGRNIGVRVRIFARAPGTNFVCGALLRGILRGLAQQALAPQKALVKEPSSTYFKLWTLNTGGERTGAV